MGGGARAAVRWFTTTLLLDEDAASGRGARAHRRARCGRSARRARRSCGRGGLPGRPRPHPQRRGRSDARPGARARTPTAPSGTPRRAALRDAERRAAGDRRLPSRSPSTTPRSRTSTPPGAAARPRRRRPRCSPRFPEGVTTPRRSRRSATSGLDEVDRDGAEASSSTLLFAGAAVRITLGDDALWSPRSKGVVGCGAAPVGGAGRCGIEGLLNLARVDAERRREGVDECLPAVGARRLQRVAHLALAEVQLLGECGNERVRATRAPGPW